MRFSRDRRGQSVVIGTVILFGFLILALSLYQVQVVPQQNGQVEFQHFEEVQNDLVELRNAVSSAGQSERPQFVDVRLGTNYQTRLFAINPPAPAGTLQTSRPYNITITDESGETENVSTRFVRYRPGYNELQVGSIWYDNSALYLDERDSDSRAVIIEDQNLVTDSDTLRITALQNEFQASGTRRVALELYPADDATNLSRLDGELTVSIPTRLGADDGYWNESIENGAVTYLGVDDDGYPSSDEVSALRLRVDSPDNITVNSVGVQSEPSEGAVRDNVGPTDGGSTDNNNGGSTDNADSVQVVDGSESTSGKSGKLIFKITADTEININAAAIETTGGLSSVGVKQNSDFSIEQTTSTSGSSADGSFDYQFDPSVAVQSDGEVKVEFDKLDTGIENIGTVDSESNADIIISLRFDDGSIKKLFFEADEQ